MIGGSACQAKAAPVRRPLIGSASGRPASLPDVGWKDSFVGSPLRIRIIHEIAALARVVGTTFQDDSPRHRIERVVREGRGLVVRRSWLVGRKLVGQGASRGWGGRTPEPQPRTLGLLWRAHKGRWPIPPTCRGRWDSGRRTVRIAGRATRGCCVETAGYASDHLHRLQTVCDE